jgi:hypothetical protein
MPNGKHIKPDKNAAVKAAEIELAAHHVVVARLAVSQYSVLILTLCAKP